MAVPDVGDIAWVDFDPVRGTEQGKRRPALFLTDRRYNEFAGRAVVCPITTGGGEWTFNVEVLPGMKTQGRVLVDQIRVVSCDERVFRTIETAPLALVHAVRLKLASLLGFNPEIMLNIQSQSSP